MNSNKFINVFLNRFGTNNIHDNGRDAAGNDILTIDKKHENKNDTFVVIINSFCLLTIVTCKGSCFQYFNFGKMALGICGHFVL